MRAAVHLFVAKGIDGTTIKDIAREAGVAEGALYRHFKSKDELAWHLFSTHLNRLTADLMAKVYPLTTAKERVHQFVDEMFAAYEEDPDLYTFLILREHSELDRFSKLSVHPGHVVLKIVEDGQKSGEIRPGDSSVLGGLLIGGVIRLGSLRFYGRLTQPLPAYRDETVAALWTMLQSTG